MFYWKWFLQDLNAMISMGSYLAKIDAANEFQFLSALFICISFYGIYRKLWHLWPYKHKDKLTVLNKSMFLLLFHTSLMVSKVFSSLNSSRIQHTNGTMPTASWHNMSALRQSSFTLLHSSLVLVWIQPSAENEQLLWYLSHTWGERHRTPEKKRRNS